MFAVGSGTRHHSSPLAGICSSLRVTGQCSGGFANVLFALRDEIRVFGGRAGNGINFKKVWLVKNSLSSFY